MKVRSWGDRPGVRLASQPVVELREGHDPLIQWTVVPRIGTAHKEASIEIQEEAQGVGVGDFPIQADRGPEDHGETGPVVAGRRGDQPEPCPDNGSHRDGPHVLLDDSGDADVSKRPGPEGDVDAARVAEELDVDRQGADPAEGHPETDPRSIVRRLRGDGGEECDKGQDQGGHKAVHVESQGSDDRERHRDAAQLAGASRGSIVRAGRRVHGPAGAALMVATLVTCACGAPDAPDRLGFTMPLGVISLLAPDTLRHQFVHPGVVYHYLWSPRGPWAVHMVQAEVPGRCDLEVRALQAQARERGESGHERVSGMVARSERRVLAAVNADFFTVEGSTVGAEVVLGRIERIEARPTVAWRAGASPWLGVAEVTEERGLRFGWDVSPQQDNLGDPGRATENGLTDAVGGFPDLIDAGARVGDLEVGRRPAFAAARHPRTGVGYDTTQGRFWLVVVDGRQTPHSAGMTLPEFAELLEALGADEAVNLDGGGSSSVAQWRIVLQTHPVSERWSTPSRSFKTLEAAFPRFRCSFTAIRRACHRGRTFAPGPARSSESRRR